MSRFLKVETPLLLVQFSSIVDVFGLTKFFLEPSRIINVTLWIDEYIFQTCAIKGNNEMVDLGARIGHACEYLKFSLSLLGN